MQFLSLGLDLSIPDRPWNFTLGIFNLQVIVSLGWKVDPGIRFGGGRYMGDDDDSVVMYRDMAGRIGPVSFYIAPSVEVPLPKYKTARTSFRD